ncbi:hypothetical protein MKW92_031177 [Papaver armeniacum]|nr:hypothetical protein MKW92_031177 [Papaver armeniacum]
MERRTEMAHAADEFTYSFLFTAIGVFIEGRRTGSCKDFTKQVNMYAVVGGDNGSAMACGKMTQRSVATCNLMLSLHFRSGRVDEAQIFFEEIPEKNVVSWTTMISGYAGSGRCELALMLFGGMQRAGIELDQVAMVAALSASKGSDGTNLQQSVSLISAVIHMYASCGAIEEAYRAFRGMPLKSLISRNTMIVGFAKQGCRVEALLTFLGVLCACSHTGMVKEGRHYFDYMLLSCEIESNIKHYGVYKNIEIAKYAGDHIAELEPDRAAGYLTLLANIYASAKK